MTSSPTPETVAAGLSEAQRKALLLEVVREGDAYELRCDWLVTPACRCALQRKGIWKNRMYSTEYTPFGLAVRAHLQGSPQ